MDIFSALADPTRHSIVELLATKGSLTTTDICSNFRMSQPAISQHLKVLREAKLVGMEKQAQRHFYSINADKFLETEKWIQKMTRVWHSRFDTLGALLEEEKKGGENI